MSNTYSTFFIPHTARRYTVDAIGTVRNQNGDVIDACIVDGHQVVTLDWIFGLREYRVAVLLLLAHGYFRDFPEHLLLKIEPLYKDASPTNLRLANLTYRFSGGELEVEGAPGFYYIPFFTRYAINREGVMITAAKSYSNNRFGEKRSWAILPPDAARGSQGGYRYVRAIADNGESRILFRHQALCWTFKRYEANVRNLVCNHLDGIPGSDALENLELTSYSENNKHAYRHGLRKGRSAIRAVNLGTGEEHMVYSASACQSIAANIPPTAVMHRLHDPVAKMRVYNDLWVFRRMNDTTPLPEYVPGVTQVHRVLDDRAVVAYDIHTGNRFVGHTCTHLGKALGVSYLAVRNRLIDDDPRPFKGYCFKYLDDKRGWPSFTERQLEIHRKYRHKDRVPNGIVVIDLVNNDEQFFASANEAATHFDMSPVRAAALARDEKIHSKRYHFKVFDVHANVKWSL